MNFSNLSAKLRLFSMVQNINNPILEIPSEDLDNVVGLMDLLYKIDMRQKADERLDVELEANEPHEATEPSVDPEKKSKTESHD